MADDVKKTITYKIETDASTGKAKLVEFEQEVTKTGEKGKAAFQKLSESFSSVGKEFTAAAKSLSLGISVPLGAFATAASAAYMSVKQGLNEIRVLTGASGKEFEDLGNSFRKVFAEVPASAEDVGKAIGTIHSRTGLAGEALESLSKTIIELAEITHQDLGTAIEASTRLFASWGVEAANQEETLNMLFKASQQTGLSFNRMTEMLTFSGPALREMGFSLTEAAALLGNFEKAGVNTEQVMMGLKKAISTLAKAGEDPKETISRLIVTLKELNKTEAIDLASKIFGPRGALGIVDAARAGRFEIDNLVKSIENSHETIKQAHEDTKTFGEVMTEMKHRVELAMEPLGKDFIQMTKRQFIPAITEMIENVKTLGDWFGKMPEGFQQLVTGTLAFATVLGPASLAIGVFATGIGKTLIAAKDFGAYIISGGILSTSIGLIAAGLAGWTIGRLIGELKVNGKTIDEWTQKLYTWVLYSKQTTDATNEFQKSTMKLNESLKTPVTWFSGETFASFEGRVLKAVAAENKLTAATVALSVVPPPKPGLTDDQRAKLEKDAETAKKAREEYVKMAEASGDLVPKYEDLIKEQEKYIGEVEKQIRLHPENIALINQLITANRTLTETENKKAAAIRLAPYHDIIDQVQKFLKVMGSEDEMLKDGTKPFTTLKQDAQSLANTFNMLGINAPMYFGPVVDQIKRTADAFKILGFESSKDLASLAEKATKVYDQLLEASKTDVSITTRDMQMAWVKMEEAQIAAGKTLTASQYEEMEKIKTKWSTDVIPTLIQRWLDLKNAWKETFSNFADDLARSLADALVSGKGIWDAIKNSFKRLASDLLALFISGFLTPLKTAMTKLGASLGDMIFGGSSTIGGSSSNGGLLGVLFGIGKSKAGDKTAAGATTTAEAGGGFDNVYADLGTIGTTGSTSSSGGAWGKGGWGPAVVGSGLAIGGGLLMGAGSKTNNPYMNVGGGAMSGAGTGMMIGSMILPGLGTAIGAAIGAAAGAIFGGIKTILARGKAKKDATALVEETSKQIWDLVDQVKSGKIAASEAKTGIDQMWQAYVDSLHANIKDNTVIQRSIDSQIFMVQQAKDAVDKAVEAERAVSAAKGQISKFMDEMLMSGKVSDEFADYITKAGFKIEDFEKALKIKPMQDFQSAIQRLSQAITPATNEFDDMIAKFLETGDVTTELEAQFKKFGATSVDALKNYGKALKDLKDYSNVFDPISEGLTALLPKQSTMMDQFIQFGIITPELTNDIYKFGLNMGDFRRVAQLTETNNDFQALINNFTWTEAGIESLRPSFISLGGDMGALDAASAIPGLTALLGTFNQMSTTLDGLLPKTKSMVDTFFETGTITPELADAITKAGGSLDPFIKFGSISNLKKEWDPLFEGFQKAGDWYKMDPASQQQLLDLMNSLNDPNVKLLIDSGDLNSAVNLASQAITTQYGLFGTNLSTELDKMKTDLGTKIDDLKKGLTDAIGILQTGLQTDLGFARQTLIDMLGDHKGGLTGAVNSASFDLNIMLGQLDSDLTTQIGLLQTAVETSIGDLAKAVSGVNNPTTDNTNPNQNQYPGDDTGNGYDPSKPISQYNHPGMQRTDYNSGSNYQSSQTQTNNPPPPPPPPASTVVNQTINIGSVSDYGTYKYTQDRINYNLATGSRAR